MSPLDVACQLQLCVYHWSTMSAARFRATPRHVHLFNLHPAQGSQSTVSRSILSLETSLEQRNSKNAWDVVAALAWVRLQVVAIKVRKLDLAMESRRLASKVDRQPSPSSSQNEASSTRTSLALHLL